MQYQEAISYIENLQKFGEGPGLHRMEKMLDALGQPHKNLQYVHVTGTNGKGSTSAFIASILTASGYKAGLYTSPHLYRYNERIQVNGRSISDVEFINCLGQVRKVLEQNPAIRPALFEVMTVMAFLYFQEQGVDVAVMEVGIGGRFDSTNVIDAKVAIITNIDLEHTALLGHTKEAIALQKTGIIKADATVITGEEDPAILKLFRAEARKQHAILQTITSRDIFPKQQTAAGQQFDFKSYKNLAIPLIGRHQLSNAAMAIMAAKALKKKGFGSISPKTIRAGLESAKWPLRLEIVHSSPTVLIDVGHNLHGIRAIKQTIEEVFKNPHRILVLGCSYDKPYREMAIKLSTLASTIIVTQANYHGVEVEKLALCLEGMDKTIIPSQNVQEAMLKAKALANEDSLVMVLGGLYLGAEAKEQVDKIF